MITFADFQKVDMKTGKVKSAEGIEGSDKLIKMEIDVGSEVRQIVSGIVDVYSPEQLVGMNVVVVMNLEPKKLHGVLSQGMILAADGEKPIILTPERDVPPGTPVR